MESKKGRGGGMGNQKKMEKGEKVKKRGKQQY